MHTYQVPCPDFSTIKYRIRLVRRRKATGEHTFRVTRFGLDYCFIHWDSNTNQFVVNKYEKTYLLGYRYSVSDNDISMTHGMLL